MVNDKSRVNIGLPVFNGEKYLRQTLDSILAQKYQDFTLIISDNASTDKTQQICYEYAKMDDRISYHRNRRNFGAMLNHNRVFELSSGEYFKWASHDDVLAPEYLEKCVRVLDNDPSIVLCHSKVGIIDENGVLVGNYDDRKLNGISSWKPHERLRDLLSLRNTSCAITGVIRRSCLAKTSLGNYIGADTNLLVEIGLMGRIYEIPERLFFRRAHPQAYTNVYPWKAAVRDYRSQLDWWASNEKNLRLVLPHLKNLIEFLRSVNRVPLKSSERWLCYREISRWLLMENGLRMIMRDLINEYKIWRIESHYGRQESMARTY